MQEIEYEIARIHGNLQGQIDFLSRSVDSLNKDVGQLKIENQVLRKRVKYFRDSLNEIRLSIGDLKDRTDWEVIRDSK